MTTTKTETMPIIHYAVMEFHADIFFASLEFHDMVETLPVIHNYALTYALDLCSAETGRVSPLFSAIPRRQQQPSYASDFAALTQSSTYITPAKPLGGYPPTMIRQYASRVDEYLHPERKIQDVLFWESNPKKRRLDTLASYFPLHGYMKVLSVGSQFLFYAYNLPTDAPLHRYIRLGKFNAKAEVTFFECTEVQAIDNNQVTTHPLNPGDITESIPLHLLTMRPNPLAMVANLSGGTVIKVTHLDPIKQDGSLISNYLPRSPRYCQSLIGEMNAQPPHRGRSSKPKKHS